MWSFLEIIIILTQSSIGKFLSETVIISPISPTLSTKRFLSSSSWMRSAHLFSTKKYGLIPYSFDKVLSSSTTLDSNIKSSSVAMLELLWIIAPLFARIILSKSNFSVNCLALDRPLPVAIIIFMPLS